MHIFGRDIHNVVVILCDCLKNDDGFLGATVRHEVSGRFVQAKETPPGEGAYQVLLSIAHRLTLTKMLNQNKTLRQPSFAFPLMSQFSNCGHEAPGRKTSDNTEENTAPREKKTERSVRRYCFE